MVGPAGGVALYEYNSDLLWLTVCAVAFVAAAVVWRVGARREGGLVASSVPGEGS
jgi:hypothetical protein